MGKLFLILTVATGLLFANIASASILLTQGTTYKQDFNTLASSGSGSAVPNGWAFLESGTNANTTYAAGTGSSNAGNTYSFGDSGSSERAFGTLQSGTLLPTIGAEFTNSGLSDIIGLTISYTGEQWRLGTSGRQDRLDFQISADATGLDNGTWVDVDLLDFLAPISIGTVGLKDGNINNAALLQTISLNALLQSIGVNGTFWIRWNDFNASGYDDGLAIDDFAITANFAPIVPEPSSLLVWAPLGLCGLAVGLQRRRPMSLDRIAA